jgi:polyribonucleotide 5'-hydroxyl-kinase
MRSYLNVHVKLEEKRERAKMFDKQGPRVIIVGPTDTGKSTLCRLLINYAVRAERCPTFVDLDIGQSSGVPGMLSAIPIERPVDVSEGFDLTMPLVYWFGDVSPGANPDLYRLQIANIMRHVDRRLQANEDASISGLIINTCGWIDGLGYDILKYAIEATRADLVLVLDNERLYSDLTQDFVNARQTALASASTHNLKSPLDVIKLNKSGGVVTRSVDYRRQTRMDKMREYFYGPSGDLCPHSSVVDFSDVQVFRIGGGPRAPTSALPIGAERTVNPTRVVEVTPGPDLVHCVLGVSHAKTADVILESNLAGFLYVTDVNFEKKKITCLAPCPGPLPGKILIMGALKWYE